MNSGNGGKPGIQTWTANYKRTERILLRLLSSPGHTLPKKGLDPPRSYYHEELVELGIIIDHGDYLELVPEKLHQHSVVVSDDLYDNFQDINWLREQRKKVGLIQGRVKGEEFRAKQQARRKQRRAYAKEQRAKRLAQPPEEMPLSEIVFNEESSD